MDKDVQDVNPLHLVLGIVIGASGALVAVQLYSVLSKRRTTRTRSSKDYRSRYSFPNESTSRSNDARLQNGHLSVTPFFPHPSPLNSAPFYVPMRSPTGDGEEEEAFPIEQIENKQEAETLLGLLYGIGESQSRQESVIHRGISCNSCGTNPLCGVRYKCVNCVDYDVCARCEPACNHPKTHVFVKILTPIPPLANPRSTMLPKFYPGNNSFDASLPWPLVLRYRHETHFDSAYIEILYEQYLSLCNDKRGITKEIFQLCLGPLTSKKNLVVKQLFSFYDHDKDGVINFEDFIHGMSVLTKGSKSERMKYIFEGYDLDQDGFISKDDLQQMLQAYHQLSMEIVRDVVRSCEEEMMVTYDDSGNRPISAVFNAPIPDSGCTPYTKKERSESNSDDKTCGTIFESPPGKRFSKSHERLSAVEAMTQDAIVELVEQIMQNADTDRDGRLSEKEFYQYAIIDTSLMAWFEAIDTVF